MLPKERKLNNVKCSIQAQKKNGRQKHQNKEQW